MRPGSIGGAMHGLRRTGNGGGTNDMLKAAKQAIRIDTNDGFQDYVSPTTLSTTTNKFREKVIGSEQTLSLSTTEDGDSNYLSSSFTWPSPTNLQWGVMDDYFDEREHFLKYVPSDGEVEHAILSLQCFFANPDASTSPSSSTTRETSSDLGDSSALDWIEPTMQVYNQRLARSYGFERVYDAVQLLQNDSSVLRMVKSLSQDKVIWDAILKNKEVVRELEGLYLDESSVESSKENFDPSQTNPNILRWLFDNMKAKLLEAIETITQFISEVLTPINHDQTKQLDIFTDKLKSTFVLTIVVLLIVVVTRAHKA